MILLPRWLSNILMRGSSERTTISSVKKSWTGSKSGKNSIVVQDMKTSQENHIVKDKKKKYKCPVCRDTGWRLCIPNNKLMACDCKLGKKVLKQMEVPDDRYPLW